MRFSINKNYLRNINKILLVLVIYTFISGFAVQVFSQAQDTPFSGSDAASYICLDSNGNLAPTLPVQQDVNGFFCTDSTGARTIAVLRPPKLQQLELWFVRILYAIWGLVASLSFVMLLFLGYQYMISRGDVTKITEIRQRIINYCIGFALVFLAVPILSTVFRLMGINNSVRCYDLELPTFQFFFTDLCTDPLNQVANASNPCAIGNASGVACSAIGATSPDCSVCTATDTSFICRTYRAITGKATFSYYYQCSAGSVWELKTR